MAGISYCKHAGVGVPANVLLLVVAFVVAFVVGWLVVDGVVGLVVDGVVKLLWPNPVLVPVHFVHVARAVLL